MGRSIIIAHAMDFIFLFFFIFLLAYSVQILVFPSPAVTTLNKIFSVTIGGRPDTKPGDHDTPNAHIRQFIVSYHMWGPGHTWLQTTLEGLVTTLHVFGGVSGRPSDTSVWSLTISWSRLLARDHVWSGRWLLLCVIGTYVDCMV